ncbi:MAG: pyroglutamyl-peptidase I [Oscillospiraceae bacterium]|nr:pyroglutamyl-peptidase I [Oscillospiraceae bacterium]MBQ3999382.1 pyroglutamyl-peptidase I [Oscillospiraceae bacterium]MBQ4239950.1 pyroglutamyl-peptidase I [Oscillospiraceae bacterium]
MKILLTAFDPFGGEPVNPAQEAVAAVSDTVAGAEIIKCVVPTVFGKSIDTVYAAMKKENPDVTFCIGQAGGRVGLTPERVAINLDDARIEDNEGNQPFDKVIREDGENAYFTSLPVKAMVNKIKEAGIPASVSYTAGTFVCNHLMYGVLYNISREFPNMKGGFMHVPFLHEQVLNRANTPSLSKDDIVKGIEAAITAIVENA